MSARQLSVIQRLRTNAVSSLSHGNQFRGITLCGGIFGVVANTDLEAVTQIVGRATGASGEAGRANTVDSLEELISCYDIGQVIPSDFYLAVALIVDSVIPRVGVRGPSVRFGTISEVSEKVVAVA